VDAVGGRYINTSERSIKEAAALFGPFDLIFEDTGSSAVVFESMQVLAKNGILVLTSITGGMHLIEIPADRINLEFVLGNKVMVGSVNASRENFESGVRDMSQAEAEYPGWLRRLLTHRVQGLENFRELFDHLQNPNGAIKIFCEVAAL
jgi:threonine dehydrogenase-like Zn-dependent dehydrogenase